MAEEKKHPSDVPEYKKKIVNDLANKIQHSKTVLIASTKNLPASQFNEIKKKLRGKAEIVIAKKSLVCRAIDVVEKGAIKNLKELIGADIALFFSDIDAFELSGMLSENQSEAKAKTGDIAPEDITIEEGPTELMPGPAISELSSVGLQVAVENGKLAIKRKKTIVKKGETIDEKSSNVMAKLGIMPMKVGFLPVGAYDGNSDAVYKDIKIDKEETLIVLQNAIGKSLGFAVDINYVCDKTVGVLIARAGIQEKALEKIVGEKEEVKEEEKVGEEKKVEDVKVKETDSKVVDEQVSEDKGGEGKKEGEDVNGKDDSEVVGEQVSGDNGEEKVEEKSAEKDVTNKSDDISSEVTSEDSKKEEEEINEISKDNNEGGEVKNEEAEKEGGKNNTQKVEETKNDKEET